jgi:hypothetical protein
MDSSPTQFAAEDEGFAPSILGNFPFFGKQFIKV